MSDFEKLNNEEIENQWQIVYSQLHEKKRKRAIFLIFLSVSVLGILSIVFLYYSGVAKENIAHVNQKNLGIKTKLKDRFTIKNTALRTVTKAIISKKNQTAHTPQNTGVEAVKSVFNQLTDSPKIVTRSAGNKEFVVKKSIVLGYPKLIEPKSISFININAIRYDKLSDLINNHNRIKYISVEKAVYGSNHYLEMGYTNNAAGIVNKNTTFNYYFAYNYVGNRKEIYQIGVGKNALPLTLEGTCMNNLKSRIEFKNYQFISAKYLQPLIVNGKSSLYFGMGIQYQFFTKNSANIYAERVDLSGNYLNPADYMVTQSTEKFNLGRAKSLLDFNNRRFSLTPGIQLQRNAGRFNFTFGLYQNLGSVIKKQYDANLPYAQVGLGFRL